MEAQTSEYNGARRADTGVDETGDRRLSVFHNYVDLCDEIDRETARLHELDERVHALRARREEFRNELLDFLGANPNTPQKGKPF